MITLITGTPGAGKTALALWMCTTEAKGRPLFVTGVKDLKLAHTPMPPLADWTHDIDAPETVDGKKTVFTIPSESVIVIDEAQDIYRPRAASSKVPDYVAALETHRHGGLDIWLVTQHPSLLDANVRKLCTRHVHIKRNILGGRKLFEWTDEIGDVESTTARSLAASRRYKPPRSVFNLYTSATAHTKVPRRVPMYAYVFAVALVALAGLSWKIYGSINERLASGGAAKPNDLAKKSGSLVTHGDQPGGTGGTVKAVSWAESHHPRVAGLPHTAPAFDQLAAPKSLPFPSACVASPSRCTCYTDQATVLQVEPSMCREIVAGGIYEAHRDVRKLGGPDASGIVRAAPARVVERSEGVHVAAIADGFNGSHVGSVESTRVVGRGGNPPSAKPPQASGGVSTPGGAATGR